MNEQKDYEKLVEEYCSKKKKWGGFKKAHPIAYEYVVRDTNFLPDGAKLSQRLWHILHRVYAQPTCLNNNCENTVKWFQGNYRQYCSTTCSCKSDAANRKRKQTLSDNYGVDSLGKIRENTTIKEKVFETNMLKYGTDNYVQSEDFKAKNRKTLIEKYNVDHYAKTDEFKSKLENTLLERYGVSHNFLIEEVKENRDRTWQERYGGNPLKNSKIREKILKTNKERYGFEHPTKSSEIKEKIIQTSREKYNRNNPSQHIISDESFILLEDREWLTKQRESGLSFGAIANSLDVDITTVISRFKKFNIPYESFNIEISKGQQQLTDYIRSLGFRVITNDRTLIHPKEVDILIPDKKLAIEYCGLYWHNELFVDKNYHLYKLQNVKNAGYDLITVFEDEWILNEDIVKSVLAHKLHKTDTKIYARKCIVKDVTSIPEANEFLNDNHLQGSINYSNAKGLYLNGELVSIMTFLVNEDTAYLNRFCNKLNYSVIGSASRLLSAFISTCENIKNVKTFADCRWSDGRLYEHLGFEVDKVLSPDYYYIHNNARYHKFLFRKSKMKRKFKSYDDKLTEHENALLNNCFRVYDCGKVRFSLTIK